MGLLFVFKTDVLRRTVLALPGNVFPTTVLITHHFTATVVLAAKHGSTDVDTNISASLFIALGYTSWHSWRLNHYLDTRLLHHTWMHHAWLSHHTWLHHSRLGHTWLHHARLGHTWLHHSWLAHTWLHHSWLAHTWLHHFWMNHTWLHHSRLGHACLCLRCLSRSSRI